MAFYTRTIQIDGVTYKQIAPTQWQNLKTGELLDSTKISFIINQFKARQVPVPPAAAPVGGCCEVVNGVMVCTQKTANNCSNGCFKGENTNCDEGCIACVHCCFAGSGCAARTPEACLAAGGTYFAFGQGCTACRFGVCSSDTVVSQRFFGDGCTGIFIVGGNSGSFDQGIYCTGSGVGQTCFGPGQRYQAFTSNFIAGGTCSNCILGACCTGGGCAGITSQSACATIGGLFYPGQTCGRCDFGVYCTGAGNDRTCIRTGYRGEALSSEFTVGATCSRCIMGTCCVNGERQVGVRQSDCIGTFFPGIFNQNACDTGSCCVGSACTENVFRYNCAGIFNNGMTCIACSSGACCLPGGGCTTGIAMGPCLTQGGTFYGGATCSACDTGSCCNRDECENQRRGDICTGNFYVGVECASQPCLLGSCCVGATCYPDLQLRACDLLSGTHFVGSDCSACAQGAICLPEFDENGNRVCEPDMYQGEVIEGGFYVDQGCSACDSGACCNLLGGGVTGIRGDCTGSSVFYTGQTLFVCDAGVFCTGSNQGQTCFALGHRGQSLTNNFILGATCSSCILGACCTGGTCLGGGLTSQAACSSAGGLFFAGRTCTVCDYGVYCTGATCLSLGYRGQSLSNNFIVGATCSSCILGACCTGGTCLGGGQTSQAACNGLFYPGSTCRACDYGVYCTGATCFELGYRAQVLTNNFIQGATCNSCILGACCTGGTCLGGGQTSQVACSVAGGTFYVGATCFQCDIGVYCTGSGVGQTCFGLGHRGQPLTNNFIVGGNCSSCILGACCTGGTCLGGGLTSQAACSAVGGLFYPGTTCVSCDYGVYCTGSNETTSCLGLGYRAQNLSNQFIISGNCVSDCTYGSCCDGITCLGITSQANCNRPYSFFAGMTCGACDTGTGACCTGGSSSITTITGCNALGGIFFPEGTTALCVTGSCCTGGTCTQEIVGRSGNCQLFIAGATCSICDTGVYCTGATCFQLGFRGQSLTDKFIVGATCNSCILGICCTGGTCIGGGVTAEIYCPASTGTFIVGATQCNSCQNNVNCCINGVHAYILSQKCAELGGIEFDGPEDPTLCESGVFCEGITCGGFGLRGENPDGSFILNGDCGDCILGNCCGDDETYSYTSQNECLGTFYPGVENENACSAEVVYGICCTGGVCDDNSEQSQCNGYFISAQTSAANNLFCENGACDIGVCCKETTVTSVTGGTCAGIMTRAECALTGGQFFLSSEGYSCTNCQYIPMLSSALFQQIANDTTYSSNQFRRTLLYPGALIGITGAEIQPVDPSLTNADTWLSSGNFNLHGSGATSTLLDFRRERTTLGSKIVFRFARPNFSIFRPWYNSGVTMSGPTLQGLTNGSFDVPPPGLTSDYGGTLGYILGDNFRDVYEVPRYLRFVFDYGNPGSTWYGQSIVMRFMGVTRPSTIDSSRSVSYSLDDATKHAGLTLGIYNRLPTPVPFRENNTTDPFSSPILVQSFAENPLKYRIRPMGSCCKGVTCLGIVTQDQCAFTGGTFYAEENCSGCDRTRILGNCCTGGTYYGYTNEVACLALNGYFKKSATPNPNICIYGSECSSSSFETCITPNIYRDQYSGAAGTTFVPFSYSRNLGCSACDRGICCLEGSCRGYIPREICSDLGGDFYENENACGDLCLTGVCCNLDQPSCGTFTRAGECRGVGKYFFLGYTQGQTCSACSSMTIIPASVAGVDYSYMFNKGTTSGTFADGTLWVQETDDLRLLNVTMKYKDGGKESIKYMKLAGGKEHTVGLTELTKHVVGFGNNEYGQCGTTLDYNDDLRLFNVLGQGFKDIAAGFYHTLAVSLGGTVSAWGRNTNGECNVPSGLTGVKAVSAGDVHSVALFENGGVTCWGGNLLGQCNIPVGLSGVTMISCGADHTLALKSDGTVVAWGNNLEGQCNVPAGLTGAKKVSAGYYHSLALFGPGSGPEFGLTSWGRNVEGQRNHPTTNVIDIAGGGFHTVIIRKEGENNLVRGYGNNTYGQSQYVYGRVDSTSVAAGEYHSLAIRSDTHFAWGLNSKGQADIATQYESKTNTKISNLQLRSDGYKGSVYINGIAKNPRPRSYYEADVGRVVGDMQPHTSLHYDNYNNGWRKPLTPLATEVASNYPAFDLNKFNEYKNSFSSYGITLAAKDVVLCNTTNFSIYNARFPGNEAGYPYQAQQQRANTLAYGVITCLSAAQAATAGSTLCFRPPVTWPNELEKPLYPVSMINPRVPGQSGISLIGQANAGYLSSSIGSVVVKNSCTSFCQVSEFGDGTDYNVITPMWTVNGYGSRESTYGEQFVFPIADVLQYAYCTTGSDNITITQNERKELITRITQYGLDCWGAMRKFCDNLRSGAGQKASRTRPWIPMAGYFLGITSMYDPEDTMRQDAGRLAKMLEYYYSQPNTVVAGPSGNPPGSCITRKQYYTFRDGDTGPENNFAGTRRFLARALAHEPFTTTEFIDDPSNWFRHYNYVGDYYKNTVISGFGPTGATGVTFYNQLTERELVPHNNSNKSFAGVTVYGNFGIIRFGSSAAWENPFPGRFSYDTKEGHDAAIQGLWLRVESGPGSSGPGGKSRFYKIINSSGFRDEDGGPVVNSLGGGSQIVIGQTWADGIPNHTSTIKFYPIIPDAMGYTRPTFYGGYTYGPVGYSIDTNPDDACGTNKAHSAQYQVSINPANTYLANSLKPWFVTYSFLDYIQRTQGVTLVSDVVPIMDHIRQYIYTSPYNIESIYFHFRSLSEVYRTWLNDQNFSNPSVQVTRINFQRDYPGVIQWKGITV